MGWLKIFFRGRYLVGNIRILYMKFFIIDIYVILFYRI